MIIVVPALSQRNSIRPTVVCSRLFFFLLFPLFQTVLFKCSIAFLVTLATFFCLKLSRGDIIAANIGQAMVNLKLWISKSSSHRQLHGGRGLNSQFLVCESHTLPLGYHAIFCCFLRKENFYEKFSVLFSTKRD